VAVIHLGLPLPTGSCGLPAGSGEQPSNACAGRRLSAATLLGLAPGGVYLATPVTRGAGELLPHRFTLTGALGAGGLFSVALSRGSPRVAVNNHPALRSPDVPRRRPAKGADATARPTRPSRLHRIWPGYPARGPAGRSGVYRDPEDLWSVVNHNASPSGTGLSGRARSREGRPAAPANRP
jgi:hypothetical protein